MALGNRELYDNLLKLAENLRIEVREEALEDRRGGLYQLKGRRHLLVNRELPVEAKADLLVEILKKENLSGVYVLPALREVLEH